MARPWTSVRQRLHDLQQRLTTAAPKRLLSPEDARRRRRQRGAALIMVLGSLTILSVMLSEFQEEMSSEFANALSDRDALKAEYAAKSAINLSRLLIASEPTVRQAAGLLLSMMNKGGKPPQIPIWAFAPQILGAFNDGEGAARFKTLGNFDVSQGSGLGLDGAGFEVTIVDEDAKIGLNAAARSSFGARDVGRQLMGLMTGPQYDPLFERRGMDGDYATRFEVCGAIIDWVDANQDAENCDPTSTAPNMGPEDSYYRNLRDPYLRKNAPFDSLDELHLVRGVSDDFWATFIDPKPEDPSSRTVSVWSQGKININTTSPRTLLAYLCAWAVPTTPLCNDTTGQLPAAFLGTMNLFQGMFSGIPVFGSPKQLLSALKGQGPMADVLKFANLDPITFLSDQSFQNGLTTESKVFSIYADGYVHVGKHETHVHIMSVVDFRKAPSVQDLVNQVQANAAQPTPTPPSSSTTTTTQQTTDDSAIQGALVPSTAGRVVYYRVN
jgi:general secretion pathway protein K